MTENADLLVYRLRIAQEKLKRTPRAKRMTRRNARRRRQGSPRPPQRREEEAVAIPIKP